MHCTAIFGGRVAAVAQYAKLEDCWFYPQTPAVCLFTAADESSHCH